MKPHLLPQPKRLSLTHGRFLPGAPLRLFLPEQTDRTGLAAATSLASLWAKSSATPVTLDRRAGATRPRGHVVLEEDPRLPAEGYRLTISTHGVQLRGGGPPGLVYGLQTLQQLVRQYGTALPCLRIADAPTFAHRGYYQDVTRGRVPTLGSLFRLVDKLAALRFNQLQLYIEHVFDFACDPAIGQGCDPLSPQDILLLDAYCREHYIELVPSLACFGHMGRILSLPAYRELAEVPWPGPAWEKATWRQRLHGSTIDPYHPGTPRLFEKLFDDFLPLFSSPHFNICGDETYDLGRGRNLARATRSGKGILYLHHLRTLRRLAAKHGKTLMCWGDMMLQYDDVAEKLPRDCTVLDWGYEPTTRFHKVRRFVEAGLTPYVCPATRGYGTVFNEVEKAAANISGYARAGARDGATGLLVTDWGDQGHFNMPATSLHGMALAAAMAWNPRGEGGKAFDRAFSLQLFNHHGDEAAQLYRKAGGSGIASWPFLLAPPNAKRPPGYTAARARAVQNRTADWHAMLSTLEPTSWVDQHDLDELDLALRALGLNAEKILLEAGRTRSPQAAKRLARELANFSGDYRKTWLVGSRPAGVREIGRALRRVARQVTRR